MNPQQQPQNFDRELNLISEVITKNNSGIIVLPAKPTPDAIAAGAALYMALTKMGKNVSLVCSQVPETDITGADKIKTSIETGGNNLVISFPYVEGAIDKVDYGFNNDKTKFNVIVIPREGNEKLKPDQVEFTYSGGKIEFIITVDSPNLNSLGDIYAKNQQLFDGKNIINIDRHLINNNYGTINVVAKTASSTSELMFKVLKALKAQVDKDIATNLYAGIVTATNNFSSYSVNADTFETVANLLRAGAVKKPQRQFARPGMGGQTGGMNPFSQGLGGFGSQQAGMPQMNKPQPQNRPQQMAQQPSGSQMQQQVQGQSYQHQQPQEKQTRAIQDVEKESNETEGNGESADPENWLKPKIFSESDGLV